MPTKFNYGQDLKPTDAPQRIEPSNYSGQPENTNYVTGQVVGSVLDQLATNPAPTDAVLGGFAVESLNVVDASARYQTEKERIISTLATADPNDRDAVMRYNDDLQRLRKGEVQGTLTPAQSQLRMNNLTKQALTAYPGMTMKILQIRQGRVSELPNISADVDSDPQVQATKKLIETARSNGWQLPDQIEYNQSVMKADIAKRTLEANLSAGSASENDVAASVLATTGIAYTHFIADMGNLITDPDAKGQTYANRLLLAKAQMEQSIRQNLVQVQLDKGFKFSPDFVNNTVQAGIAPMESLLKIADKLDNPKTRAETAQYLLAELRAKSQMGLIEKLGPIAALASGSEDLMKYVNDISQYRQQIQKGLRPELDALAKSGDVKSQLILSVIDGKNFDTALADAIKVTTEGKDIPKASTEFEDKARAQVSFNAALNPKSSAAESEKMLTTLARRPDAFEAWDSRSDVRSRTKMFTSTQDALRDNASKQQVSTIRTMTNADVADIKYDPTNPNGPFVLASQQPTMAASVAPAGVRVPGSYVNPTTTGFIDDLNRQYRVIESFSSPTEMVEWGKSTLNELAVAKNPQAAEEAPAKEPEKAPVEPAKPAPIEATVTKAGDVQFGRFIVDRTTYAITDTQKNMTLSPPALERLRASLKGAALDQLETALDFSYNTEESDNGPAN